MGGLCSREDRETFDDVKSGNHSKQNANNHVISGGHPSNEEATVPASELLALKAQLQQLQDRNSALLRELSAAKDTAQSLAELQSKHQELQTEHNGLQKEYETTRQQLAGSGLQAQLEARAEAERKLAEVQKQFSELRSMNNQLRRRVSDLATGHAEPPVAPPAAVMEVIALAHEGEKVHPVTQPCLFCSLLLHQRKTVGMFLLKYVTVTRAARSALRSGGPPTSSAGRAFALSMARLLACKLKLIAL